MIISVTSKQIDKSHYFSVIYPFLHIAHSPEDMVKIGDIPSSVIKGLAIQRMIKGIYKTIKVFIDSLGIKKDIFSYRPPNQDIFKNGFL